MDAKDAGKNGRKRPAGVMLSSEEKKKKAPIGGLEEQKSQQNEISSTCATALPISKEGFSPRRFCNLENNESLNAKLQKLTKEINFYKNMKPVRLEEVKRLNPFNRLASPSTKPAGPKPVDTDWLNLAKIWQESLKAIELQEEMEKKGKHNDTAPDGAQLEETDLKEEKSVV